ncbi:hypothetical protein SDC9_33603 [bioreactor metagenome]|jgi:uncharacterized protein YlaN (UPF0358 family)|uniref:Uncharacterized protein n=1 Tax=bioreactor metagenome TaxID=1076179 RepID=A0A644VA29_9ZZZZ
MMAPATLSALTRALRKVMLRLTWQQLGSLALITATYTHRCRPDGVGELANLYTAYKLSEKMRLKIMRTPQPVVRLNLTMPEAAALSEVLDSTCFGEFAVYEINLAMWVIGEIDKQTV